jgi:fluoride ion exporter CrcB/FEX
MNLVWKLLRQHISVPQLAGFFFANLFGMFIVLMGYQFYRDVVPVFTAKDTFMKADFMVISKKIGTATTISGFPLVPASCHASFALIASRCHPGFEPLLENPL